MVHSLFSPNFSSADSPDKCSPLGGGGNGGGCSGGLLAVTGWTRRASAAHVITSVMGGTTAPTDKGSPARLKLVSAAPVCMLGAAFVQLAAVLQRSAERSASSHVKVIRSPLYPPHAHTTTTALHVLGMARHCTGIISGVAAAHRWPGWPCSARVPELQLVSDGSLQRRRTPTALQGAR